ncbi:DUF3099 domain-containing protein [Sanguibacter antarcticus]|uniref:DUF3099 family protein n=1 Tax=Sanguibacter antarcticus TaxID=372484 RepID=A0A2A9E416_9MICO|nr:DUF3099 domain-containing protein [Sanguibacter antarcticus]PFG33376.1 Protein of unknown function (DUF3099) [Sanguibacter antarcticus]
MKTPGSIRLGRRGRGGTRTDGSTGPRQTPEVYRITSAADSLSDDQSRRVKRYLLQMSIRMACIIGAVFVDGIFMWVLLLGAVLLPYAAVIDANSGRERRDDDLPPMDYHRQLPGVPVSPTVPLAEPSSYTAGAHHV